MRPLAPLPVATLCLAAACTLGDLPGGGVPPGGRGSILVYTDVSVGGTHSCAVANATAFCWGTNFGGELGNSTRASSDGPVRVLATHIFGGVTAGGGHTCAITTNGFGYCWGFNDFGQLGDATTELRLTPTAVAGGLVFSSLVAGTNHSCGLTLDGSAYCWGSNAFGELGTGNMSTTAEPLPVAGGLAFRSMDAGGVTCGLTDEGEAHCWGRGWGLTPSPVPGGIVLVSVSAGESHACGLDADGVAFCWGENGFGQLGTGTIDQDFDPTPRAVAGGLRFTSISAGTTHSCGIASDERIYCWGNDVAGQLGDGDAASGGGSGTMTTPTRIHSARQFGAVSAGLNSSCGLTTEFVVYCWGLRTGNRALMPSPSPVPISPP